MMADVQAMAEEQHKATQHRAVRIRLWSIIEIIIIRYETGQCVRQTTKLIKNPDIMANLPSDPFMLLSLVNMRLRDQYSSLDDFCDAEGIGRDDLTKRLAEAGFEYMPEINQFR